MDTQKEDDKKTSPSSSSAVLSEVVAQRYQKIRENAETYPYVWASYILVYGGFALWGVYRWRKLRKTEDRVRSLQQRLRELVEAEESAGSAKPVEKTPPPTDKTLK